jgi:hypothetical protein
VRNETADEVTVIDSGGAKHVLKKSNILSRKVSQISLMPEGLQNGLSVTEFSDLISYVENPVLPEATKPPALAFHSNPTAAPSLAHAPTPEPGADLFSFLDIGPSQDGPDRLAAPTIEAPPAARPTPSTGDRGWVPHNRPLPPRLPPPPAPATDDSSQNAQPVPPSPPGLNLPPPPPSPRQE